MGGGKEGGSSGGSRRILLCGKGAGVRGTWGCGGGFPIAGCWVRQERGSPSVSRGFGRAPEDGKSGVLRPGVVSCVLLAGPDPAGAVGGGHVGDGRGLPGLGVLPSTCWGGGKGMGYGGNRIGHQSSYSATKDWQVATNGKSFLVFNEQRFAKEILPKYFKHNNMASFVRQLNMYGFRKVVHVDSRFIKLERDGPVEFRHAYFRQGREDLLKHIKRKVSSSRPEENKISQDDLSKIICSAQKMQIKQTAIEAQLSLLKRENESLWREVSELRAKHLQQQQVIRKIVQFIVTLVQNNQLVSLKRKRPLLLNTNGPTKSNVFQKIVKEPADSSHHVPLNRNEGLKQREQISDDIVIYDVTEDVAEEEHPVAEEEHPMAEEEHPMADEENLPVTPETSEDNTSDSSNCSYHSPDIVIVEDDNEDEYAPVIQGDKNTESVAVPGNDPASHVSDSTSPLMSSAVQLNNQSALTAEDPVSVMDSILNENGVISQNINLLGKVELLDYLDSIDCSLEDFQAMLSGRQFSIDPDLLVDLFTSSVQMNPTDHDHITNTKVETKGKETNKNNAGPAASQEMQEKQLIHYTAFPLLAFLDGNPGSAVESGAFTAETPSTLEKSLEGDELLESSLDPQLTQSKLVRLEPLTEAEASEATLFYLCELAPAPMDTDMSFMDN